MSSYKELKAQAEEILRQAELQRKAEIPSAVAEILAKMREFDISVDDLRRALKRVPMTRSATRPTYKDPKSGETWSGRGRMPKWLAAQLAKGKRKEDFVE